MEVEVAESCLTLCHPMDCPWDSPGQSAGVGGLSLLQQREMGKQPSMKGFATSKLSEIDE